MPTKVPHIKRLYFKIVYIETFFLNVVKFCERNNKTIGSCLREKNKLWLLMSIFIKFRNYSCDNLDLLFINLS